MTDSGERSIERRQAPRFAVHFRTALSAPHITSGSGTALDLSASGCRVQSSMNPLIGMHVTLRISVPGQDRPITIERAAIRWSGANEFGLQFVITSPREQERLKEVVRRVQEKV